MSAPRINLTIDRLVLRGVDPQHAQAMTESLKKELARIFAAPGGHERLQQAKDAPGDAVGPRDAGAGSRGSASVRVQRGSRHRKRSEAMSRAARFVCACTLPYKTYAMKG